MDMQTFTGLVRAALAFLGGLIVSKGYVNTEDWMTISGGVLALATALWTVIHHTSAGRAIAATAGEVTTPQEVRKKIIP